MISYTSSARRFVAMRKKHRLPSLISRVAVAPSRHQSSVVKIILPGTQQRKTTVPSRGHSSAFVPTPPPGGQINKASAHAAHRRSGVTHAAQAEQPRFSSAEIEELTRMLQKAAPKTLETMSTGRTPLLTTSDPEAQRAQIREYFHATFDKTEQLFQLFTKDEAYYIKHEPLRHPPIFYYGHTACFFINKLILAGTISERISPKIEHMCAVGVDEMSWDDLNENHYDWPEIAEVNRYRDQVRELVDNLIATMPMDNLINWDSPWWPIIMGIEHENIHTETSSAIFRQAPLDMMQHDNDNWRLCHVDTQPPQNELLAVDAATVVCDKNSENPRVYGWDNEFGNKVSEVPAFKASKYLVSNSEFMEFVGAGGYKDQQWWGEEGWAWVQHTKAEHPKYWLNAGDGKWRQRQLAVETPLPWSWPVVANQLECKAFCNWKTAQTGKPIRLPSEDEWKVLRQMGEHGQVDQPDWPIAPGNINLEHFASECPVDMFEWGGTGFYDVIGNVWQWTESPIDGLPGFKVHPLYDDFAAPTFDGKHTLFKGGSWISMGANGATADSRYSFRRHFFQHAGFRYVESENEVDQSMNLYETDERVLREIDTQYSALQGLPLSPVTFAQQCASQVAEVVTKLGKVTGRVLDLNCSVGRRTFELAQHFDEVVGVDDSARYIKAAVRLQDEEIVRYTVPTEGTIQSFHEVSLSELGLANQADKCVFVQQPDVTNLDQVKLGEFDVVLAPNVIEKLSTPRDFFRDLHNFVKPGGLLLVASTYNWDAEVTPFEEWIGGYKCPTSGENITTLEGMTNLLKTNFRRLDLGTELTEVKRDTLRSLRVDVSEVTVWERM